MSIKNDYKKKKESSSAKASADREEVKIDFGIGKISFGGLFQGIGSVIDLVSKMEEEGKGGTSREGEFTSPSGRVKAVYGFSVKTSVGGKPIVEPFGNVRKTPKGPVVEEERQPLVDVFDEKDHVLVIIELPGIEKEHISTALKGDILTISAVSSDPLRREASRKYYKEVILSKDVDASTLKSKYKNGVLEIRIDKK